jgi:curved DNA-binding protein CbpA
VNDQDYYSVLGVSPHATPSEIKDQYRFLCHAFHPDKHQSTDKHRRIAEEKIKRINAAYEILSDPDQRAQFDQSRQSAPPPPVAEKVAQPGVAEQPGSVAANELLAEVRPSWWHFFWLLFFFFLIVPWIVAWYRRASVVLRVFPNRVALERGVFSKCYRDFLPRDIRSIDIDQSLLARMVGIGDITISTAATVEGAERIKGIPDPKGIRELILKQRGNL